MPAVPKPPIITVAPSAMSATAEAQVHCDLSIIPAASGHRADAALVDLVVDAVDQCGQREVEADLAERPVHVVGLDAGRVGALDDLADQPVAGGVGEVVVDQRVVGQVDLGGQLERSEEPTSELPSLMPHSYDVFCLKQKKR